MIWQNLATMGANLDSGVASSLNDAVVIVMREKGCVVSSGHGARHRGRHTCACILMHDWWQWAIPRLGGETGRVLLVY